MTQSIRAGKPTLHIQTGAEKSANFAVNFSRNVRHFVMRLTGGCGLMTKEDAIGLRNLTLALSGRPEDPEDTTVYPRFAGFCLNGGSRMLLRSMPSIIVPGITEVAPAIQPHCPGAVFLGVVAKTDDLVMSEHGIVLAESEKDDYFTIIHPTQQACLVLQPGVDTAFDPTGKQKVMEPWTAERLECARLVAKLHTLSNWESLLPVYNGGGVSKAEIEDWAERSMSEPEGGPRRWNVLLVNGSGRIADQLANDSAFLNEFPHVKVADNTLPSLRKKLLECGAIVYPHAVLPQPPL